MKKMTIDRIEGKIAVCEIDKDNFVEIAVPLLPEGAKSGDCIVEDNGQYTIDKEETENKKAVVEDLLKDIFK